MIKSKSGFTIVELLIVIVVIGILAAITIVAYNGVQQRARDTKRIDDIGKIATAMQLWSINADKSFEDMNTGYSGPATGWFRATYSSTPSVKTILVGAGYLVDGVDDPLRVANGRDYMLTRCTTATDNRRVLFARLENIPSQTITQQLASSGCNDANIANFSTGSYNMNYVVVVSGN